MALRRRLAVLKGQWPDGDTVMEVGLLSHSQFVDDATKKRTREDEWRQHHDPALEVAMTRKTLQRMVLYHGSLVKVSSEPSDNPGRSHIARVIASSAPAMRDGVAYLSPFLAHNMGLQLHLEAFLTAEMLPEASSSQGADNRVDSGSRASTSGSTGLERQHSAGHVSEGRRVKVAFLDAPTQREGFGSVLQPGCQAASVRIAGKAVLQKILVPDADVVRPKQADSEEVVLAALQKYLKKTPRILMGGDVFAVPLPETGSTAALFSAAGKDVAPRVVHFKVTQMSPEWETSLMVDPSRTRVTVEGVCRSALPSNALSFLQSSKASSPVPSTLLESARESQTEPLALWHQIAAILAPLLHKTACNVALNTAALLEGPPGSELIMAASRAAAALGAHLVVYTCEELRGPSDLKTAAALKAAFEAAAEFSPAILVLQDLPALIDSHNPSGSSGSNVVRVAAAVSECLNTLCEADGERTVMLLGTAALASDVPPLLRRCFTHELTAGAPDLGQRSAQLHELLADSMRDGEACLQAAALKTAGFLPAELNALAADAAAAAVSSSSKAATVNSDCSQVRLQEELDSAGKKDTPSDGSLGGLDAETEPNIEEADVEAAVEGIRKRTAANMGAPQVPDVKWSDVGGLEDIKEAILETVELPLKHPELFHSGLRRRSGLLLYGPPGTGKTLVAKAVATECNINFLSVKGPELINMYIGESERQVREVFERARRARPCVLFFDELDSLAPARGAGADSGGVMDRVVSQLLAEIDGLQSSAAGARLPTASSQDIFLIGATNRPDLLDSSLMRPGRLDKLLYAGIAQRKEDKMKVLQALTRKFTLAPSVNLDVIAQGCSANLTGADLYALCADAWMVALRRSAMAEVEGKEVEDKVKVEQSDFRRALTSLAPSLSQDEIARYAALRSTFLSL